MASYLITHGLRATHGFDPRHTEAGLQQIRNLTTPDEVMRVVVGSGSRFQEIADILFARGLESVQYIVSPLCGGAEGYQKAANGHMVVVTASWVEIPEDEYSGLRNTPGFNPWAFVQCQGDNTLFCAGGELLLALGWTDGTENPIPPKGALFELDLEQQTVTLIQQG